MALSSTTHFIKLPEITVSSMPVEEALMERRSVRSFSDERLTPNHVSQLLWAAQGITHTRGFRTSPSAGALYPLELYLVAGKVQSIAPGSYKYAPVKNGLLRAAEGDLRGKICAASLHQSAVCDAPAVVVLTAVYERVTVKYGDRGQRYVHMEAGHAAQNLCLQAVALNLGSVVIGAFSDNDIKKALNLPPNEVPLYVIPVGFPEK
jgi:SagB-type dehydrogenase family enzyme